MRIFYFCLLNFFICSNVFAATIEGQVLEKGTKLKLSQVNVFLLPQKLKTTTDSDGRFRFENITSPFSFVVNFSGYEKLELKDEHTESELKNLNTVSRKLYLERTSYQSEVYETTIYDRANKRDDSSKTLRASEFLQLPGSNGDPVKAVQNLPGVARPQAFSAQVVIQGSAPQDTKYWIDGHEVPLIFHFGGLTSVVTPEAIDRVEYLSAGYGPEFSRALGGQVGIWTKAPQLGKSNGINKKSFNGFVFVDVFNTGGLIETPVGSRSTILLTARQSYIGAVLRKILKNNKDFNLTVAPQYSDASLIFDSELSSRDQFKAVLTGSQDELSFLFNQPLKQDPSIRGTFNNRTSFFRLIPQLTHTHSAKSKSRYSLGFGRDWIRVDVGENYFFLNTFSLTSRFEFESELFDFWTSVWGVDNSAVWADVDLKIPSTFSAGGVFNPISSGTTRQVHVSKKTAQTGLYWRNTLHPQQSAWTVMPGLRFDHFSDTDEVFVFPRLAARYALDESLFLKSSAGLYAQRPLDQETDSTVGNPDIKSPTSVHATLGAEKNFSYFSLNSGGFYKRFYKLVTPSNAFVRRNGQLVAENFTNKGKGEVIGFETLFKFNYKPFLGWISYTLSKSTRSDQYRDHYLFRYDQTHMLTLLGSVELPSNWKISSRFRYITGNPVTPITGGVFDADNDVYIPLRGPFYSDRLSAFTQLDVRVDKKIIFQNWILSFYLDIQNVMNRKNTEGVRYAYNYASSTNITGLPILPTFGVKGEF